MAARVRLKRRIASSFLMSSSVEVHAEVTWVKGAYRPSVTAM
jgi:hypothetical protein